VTSDRLKSGFLMRLLDVRLDRGTNRTAPNDLAQGAEGGGFLGGLQGCSTLVVKLADTGNSAAVIVKDFGGIDVDFTG